MSGLSGRLLTVILHYGDARSTARLHRQFHERPAGGEVRVLDNAAPEPYPQAWKRLATNIYWAGALAHTLELAEAEGFSHLWFLNNDIVFLRSGSLVGYAWHRLQRIEAKIGRVAVYSPSVTANPYHGHMVRLESGDFRTVAYVDGIAPLISLEYWREAGLDWSDNPIGYGVDVAFSLKAPHLGWNLAVDHTLVMRHRYHETARSVPGFMHEAARLEESFLSARLGPDHRTLLQRLSLEFSEHS
jgi:GT2 family glycosyltransferase